MLMKLELLKSIITDLHLAGIHDIPANSFMDQEKIDSQELVKAVFNDTAETSFESFTESENFDEANLASEMNELFAAFGSGKRPDLGSLDMIETKQFKPKTAKKVQTNIVDPRLNKNKIENTGDLSKQLLSKTTTAKKVEPAKSIEFKPELFIKTKAVETAKLVLLLPYKDESQLKVKSDFTLLQNILKAIKLDYENVSIIFVDTSYKNITLGDKKYDQLLAQSLEKELKSIKQQIILSFGQDCLSLANPTESNIRQASAKAIDVLESKKLLANYSLSAMVNTPKYKTTTWTNLLLINKL